MIIRTLCLLLSLATANSYAADERWFEVEILLFAQKDSDKLSEDFSVLPAPLKRSRSQDLISEGYQQQGQQLCLGGDSRFIHPDIASELMRYPFSPACERETDYLSLMRAAPVTPFALPRDDMETPYLLSEDALQFSEKISMLRRKGLTPLLHTGWRFPGQSKSRAPAYHLYGGERLYTVLDPQFKPEPVVSMLTDTPNFAVFQNPLWQLDGYFKIHLNHYLYITADFDINSEQDAQMQKARFSQFRRVISGEIHYFDHPQIGMLVQIRRFKH